MLFGRDTDNEEFLFKMKDGLDVLQDNAGRKVQCPIFINSGNLCINNISSKVVFLQEERYEITCG